jgi:hypothetical protein
MGGREGMSVFRSRYRAAQAGLRVRWQSPRMIAAKMRQGRLFGHRGPRCLMILQQGVL